MRILTQDLREKLLANGRRQQPLRGTKNEIDFMSVVKLFTPDAAAGWLLTEIDPDEPDTAFGLCYLGVGCPKLGSVSLAELAALRGRLGLPIERDWHFQPLIDCRLTHITDGGLAAPRPVIVLKGSLESSA